MLNHMGASFRIAFANTLIYTNWNPGTPFVSNCTCALTLNLIQFWLLNRLEQLLILTVTSLLERSPIIYYYIIYFKQSDRKSFQNTHVYTHVFFSVYLYNFAINRDAFLSFRHAGPRCLFIYGTHLGIFAQIYIMVLIQACKLGTCFHFSKLSFGFE